MGRPQRSRVPKTPQNVTSLLSFQIGPPLVLTSHCSVGEQLYQDSTHFLLELIQNADDNSYNQETVPTLSFSLGQTSLQIDCNETGFERKHVEAICSVALSTKTGHNKAAQFVGEKGIGFKSVFRVADVVWISSGCYSFKFDKRKELGMIAPIWDKFPGRRIHGYTSFYLMLSADCDKQELVDQLLNLDPKCLMFLRRLRRINIRIEGYDRNDCNTALAREDSHDLGSAVTTLHKDLDSSRYLLFRRSVTNLPVEEKRNGTSTTEIAMAFPLNENVEPNLASQFVYAFLPVRQYGFNVNLQHAGQKST